MKERGGEMTSSIHPLQLHRTVPVRTSRAITAEPPSFNSIPSNSISFKSTHLRANLSLPLITHNVSKQGGARCRLSQRRTVKGLCTNNIWLVSESLTPLSIRHRYIRADAMHFPYYSETPSPLKPHRLERRALRISHHVPYFLSSA